MVVVSCALEYMVVVAHISCCPAKSLFSYSMYETEVEVAM